MSALGNKGGKCMQGNTNPYRQINASKKQVLNYQKEQNVKHIQLPQKDSRTTQGNKNNFAPSNELIIIQVNLCGT